MAKACANHASLLIVSAIPQRRDHVCQLAWETNARLNSRLHHGSFYYVRQIRTHPTKAGCMGFVWEHADSFLRSVDSPFHSFVTTLERWPWCDQCGFSLSLFRNYPGKVALVRPSLQINITLSQYDLRLPHAYIHMEQAEIYN